MSRTFRDLAFTSITCLLFGAGCEDNALVTFCALPVEGSPVRGPDDAWVTIVEFSDFECSYCGRVAPVVDRARNAYSEDVRVVFKTLHKRNTFRYTEFKPIS